MKDETRERVCEDDVNNCEGEGEWKFASEDENEVSRVREEVELELGRCGECDRRREIFGCKKGFAILEDAFRGMGVDMRGLDCELDVTETPELVLWSVDSGYILSH